MWSTFGTSSNWDISRSFPSLNDFSRTPLRVPDDPVRDTLARNLPSTETAKGPE